MSPTTLRRIVALGLILVVRQVSAQGAFGVDEGGVSGTGSAEIKKMPERLRVQVDLLAKGKNVSEAIQRLKERRQAATAQLKTLGAAESVRIESAKIFRGGDQRQQMLNMMIRQRVAGGRGKAKPSPVNLPVTVTAKLTAEWPLKAANADELLTVAHDLQEKIKAADVAGTKETEKLSDEEKEMMEEMEGADQMGMYGEQEQKPGTPVFLYVAAVNEKERAAAMSEAFKKAKDQATKLAQAAGSQLGPLRTLNSNSSMVDDNDPYGDQYQRYAMQMLRQQVGGSGMGETNEAVGVHPGEIAMQVFVTASFAFQSPPPPIPGVSPPPGVR